MLTGLIVAALALSVVALIVAVGAATRIVELERQLRAMPSGPAGLAPGMPVPDLTLKGLDESPVNWSAFARGPSVAIFVSPDCKPCVQLMEALPGFHDLHPDWAIVLLAKGERSRLQSAYSGLPATVALDDGSAADAFGTIATPQAFVLRKSVVTARGHPNTLEDLERLIAQAHTDAAALAAAPAPSR